MSNCQSLFGMTAVPTDNHIRAMLDPVHPSHLQPAFDQTLEALIGFRGGEAGIGKRSWEALVREQKRPSPTAFWHRQLGC